MNDIKSTNVFRKYLISYTLILLIPLITGSISYQVSIRIIKSSSVEASLLLLNQSKDILDRRMQEIEGFTRQLAMNQDLLLRCHIVWHPSGLFGMDKDYRRRKSNEVIEANEV